MKKIIGLFAVIATLCAMTTSVFAWSITGTVEGTGASLSGTTITAGEDGFIFKYVGDSAQAGGTSTADVSKLVADGWTISEVETPGVWCYKTSDVTQNFTSGKVKVQFANVLDENAAGQPYLMFKATPSASSTFANLTFTVTPMFSLNNVGGSGLYGNTNKLTYTVVKGASKDESVTVNGTDVVTITYGADATDRNLEGQTIVKGDLGAKTVTKDTKFKVTYNGVTRTFNLWGELGFVGAGTLTAEDITIGVAFRNAVSASEVQFEVE